jgi:hypothetical protein
MGLRGADAEGETSFRGVRIDGKRTPAHLLAAGRQRFQADPHGVTDDLRLGLIDPRAARVRYLTELNAGSSFCVNVSTTSRGGERTVLPTSWLA